MVTVKGVEVRAEEVNVETEFCFLTEEGQKRVFLENKEKFLLEALNSDYFTVRRLLFEPEVIKTCSAAVLNEAIKIYCVAKSSETMDIMALIDAVGSELSEANRELIALGDWLHGRWKKMRIRVATDPKTSFKILKMETMFRFSALELIQSNDSQLFDAIVQNPNFEWDKEIEEQIEVFSPAGREIIRQRVERL